MTQHHQLSKPHLNFVRRKDSHLALNSKNTT